MKTTNSTTPRSKGLEQVLSNQQNYFQKLGKAIDMNQQMRDIPGLDNIAAYIASESGKISYRNTLNGRFVSPIYVQNCLDKYEQENVIKILSNDEFQIGMSEFQKTPFDNSGDYMDRNLLKIGPRNKLFLFFFNKQ